MRDKIVFLMFLLLTLTVALPVATALTINDIKVFEEDNIKELTIKESVLGSDKATITLLTELKQEVGLGKNVEVGRFKARNLDSIILKGFFNEIENYDIVGTKLERNTNPITMKYLTYVTYEMPNYQDVSVGAYKNGTTIYEQQEVGKKKVVAEQWNDLSTNDLLEGQEITIGLFTDTTKQPTGEWIPTFLTKKVTEWAEWTAGLNFGLSSYWTLNQTSANAIDSLGNSTGVDTGISYTSSGCKIDNCYTFGGSDKVLFTPQELEGESEISINAWWKMSSAINDVGVLTQSDLLQFPVTSGGEYQAYIKLDGSVYRPDSDNAYDTVWHMHTITYNGTHLQYYIDGFLEDTVLATGSFDTVPYPYGLGGWIGVNGVVDEVGIWVNKTLTQTEVTQLYNGGDGITYTDTFASPGIPAVTIHNPINDTYTTSTVSLDVSANDTVSTWLYNLNSAGNITFTPNTTISIIEGLNELVVWANGTGGDFNRTQVYFTGAFPPEMIDLIVTPLNGSRLDTGLEFITNNLSAIEYSQINFTLRDDTGLNDVFTMYYTANGSNACTPGNEQIGTCYNYSSDKWIQFINGTTTTTFRAEGNVGDFITCEKNTVNSTWHEYSCLIDEHYNPNIMKWYSANYDFADVKYQTTSGTGLIRVANLIRVPLAGIVPLNADQYKLDFRVQIPAGTTAPLEAWACNSTYTVGNPQINQNCVIVASKTPTEITENGEKFRAIFTKQLVDSLGDGKYIVLRSSQASTGTRGYGIKTYGIQNGSHTQKWEYSTDTGATWVNSGDGYETEMNINWFSDGAEPTSFVFKINSSDTLGNTGNSTTQNITWLIDPTQNYPPIVAIQVPMSDTTQRGSIIVNWTAVDPNDDEYEIIVQATNSTATYNITTGLPNGTTETTWDTTLFTDGIYNLTVIAIENATAEGLNGTDTHTNITIDNTAPIVIITSPTNTTYTAVDIPLNISTDGTEQTLYYSVNSAENITFTGNTTITGMEGANNISLYWNDTVGNANINLTVFNITLPDILNVTLETPLDNNVLVVGNTNFVSSVIGGTGGITNATIFTNKTGSWAITEFKDLTETEMIGDNSAEVETTSSTYVSMKNITLDNAFVHYTTGGFGKRTPGSTVISIKVRYHYTDDTIGEVENTTQGLYTAVNYNLTNPQLAKDVTIMEIFLKRTGDEAVEYNTEVYGYNKSTTASETFVINLTEGIEWNVEYCNGIGECNQSIANFTVSTDDTKPIINITHPIGTQNSFAKEGKEETINWTIIETLPDTCWYEYNNINTTVASCTSNGTFMLVLGNYEATLWANDTSGNLAVDTTTWDYTITVYQENYTNTTAEGNIETFAINLSAGGGLTIDDADLIYSGTRYPGQLFSEGGTYLARINDFVVPGVTATQNNTFYWSFTLSDNSVVNITDKNQTVTTLGIDDCAVFTNQILNFTLLNETDQTLLDGTIEYDISVYSSDRTALLLQTSKGMNGNTTQICLENAVSTTDEFRMDVVVKYYSGNHSVEYYNIANGVLNNNTDQDIYLYDLLKAESTEFRLTFRNELYEIIEGALINLQRQYIPEDNVFKTVEQPLTDSNGQTIVHLVKHDVVYNIVVTQNGTVVGTFNNLVAFCEDELVGDCQINLNAFLTTTEAYDQESSNGVTFSTPTYNDTTKEVAISFVTTDGTTKTVNLTVIRANDFGNRTLCTSSLLSSGGTITCGLATNTDNSSIISTVYINGVEAGTSYSNTGSPGYGDFGYFTAFILILSFVIMFSSTSKSGIIIGILVGFITSIALTLIEGGIIGIGSAGIWLLVASIIMLYKLNKGKTQ